MKKISEYFSKKENQIETVALFSESQNANNFQDNTHENLLFVQSDDATDSTAVVESPSFTEEPRPYCSRQSSFPSKKGRKFKQSWNKKYKWVLYDCEKEKVFCSTCIKATQMKMPLPRSSREKDSYEAFILNGFSNWKKALQIFGSHERSELHRASVSMIASATLELTVIQQLNHHQNKEMMDNRTALTKIFTTLLYFVIPQFRLRKI